MQKHLKWAATSAVAAAGALATLWGGAQAWEAMGLPRWAWKTELTQVAEQSTDTRVRVLILQKEAAESAARDIEFMRYKLQSANEPIPPGLYAMEREKRDTALAIQREIERLTAEGQ